MCEMLYIGILSVCSYSGVTNVEQVLSWTLKAICSNRAKTGFLEQRVRGRACQWNYIPQLNCSLEIFMNPRHDPKPFSAVLFWNPGEELTKCQIL